MLQNICKSKYIDDYFIATDNLHKVSKIIKNNKIRFFKIKKSSSAIAQTEVVISEFIKQKNVDIVVLVQATNPFIKNIYLDQALEILINQKLDSLLSVVKSKNFIWKNSKYSSPINYNLIKEKCLSQLEVILLKMVHFIYSIKKIF